jgi:hypothetical protein
MDLEMTEMCGAKPTGVEYLTYRQNGHGQAYWLERAAGVVLWGKRKTLYRIVHMRSGAHLLGKVGRLFGVGDADGHCACGNGVRECPSPIILRVWMCENGGSAGGVLRRSCQHHGEGIRNKISTGATRTPVSGWR